MRAQINKASLRLSSVSADRMDSSLATTPGNAEAASTVTLKSMSSVPANAIELEGIIIFLAMAALNRYLLVRHMSKRTQLRYVDVRRPVELRAHPRGIEEPLDLPIVLLGRAIGLRR